MKPWMTWLLLLGFAASGCESRHADLDSMRAGDRSERREPSAESASVDPGLEPHPIPRLEVEWLRQLGLRDPIRDLVADLRRHPELLPFQPPPKHSQFGFYDSTRIRVLTNRWVYAYTHDGHGERHVLLRYRVREGGAIDWKVIAFDDGQSGWPD